MASLAGGPPVASAGLSPDANGQGGAVSAARSPGLVPHQLPDPPAWLAGRDTELGVLDQMLTAPGRGPVTVVISGVPGAGRTALAAWWLHQHRGRFTGGQVYARLAGPHGLGETPQEALGRWLRALGVPAGRVPARQADRVRLWQSVTAGLCLAVLVDDAPSAVAAAALLPGPGPGRVLITSRRRLAAGPAAGFGQLRLRLLNRPASSALLIRSLGDAPVNGERSAVGELARACGGLPMALHCAARLAAASGEPLAGLAGRLNGEQTRLVARGVPRAEARTRAVIEAASQQLEPAVARAFRLLSMCPGPEISTGLAAAVLDTSLAQTGKLLGELARAGLLECAGGSWWRFCDLAQLHAFEQAGQPGTGAGRRAVTSRMLTWYACAAITAHADLDSRGGAPPATRAGHLGGEGTSPGGPAADWVDRHQPALIAALRAAAARGDHAAAVGLAGVLWPLLGWHGSYTEELAVVRLGVRAARACGDAPAEARMLAGMDPRSVSSAGPQRRPVRCAVRHGSGLTSATTTSSPPRCANSAASPPHDAARPKLTGIPHRHRGCTSAAGSRLHGRGRVETWLRVTWRKYAVTAQNAQDHDLSVRGCRRHCRPLRPPCRGTAAKRLLTHAGDAGPMHARGGHRADPDRRQPGIAPDAASPACYRMGHQHPRLAGHLDLPHRPYYGDRRHRQPLRAPGDPGPGRRPAGLLQMALRTVPGAGTRSGLPFLAGELILLTYYCPALWRIATLAWRCSRRTKVRHIDMGMRAISAAAAADLALILIRAAAIIKCSSGTPVAEPEIAAIAAAQAVVVILVIGSATVSAWFPGLAMLSRHGQLWYAYRQLHPLWATLRHAVPQIELPRQPGTRFNVRYRLYRRVRSRSGMHS